jgi:hypothetical protein
MSTLKTGKVKTTTIADELDTESTAVTNVINGSAKAWVNFNGTGTVAIQASFNVSSITDHGTGAQSINMTNAMVDSSYCVLVTGKAANSVDYQTPLNSITDSSTFRIYTSNGTTLTDTSVVCCSVFR